ncbi:nuclear transport factor 2 family protein [Sphingobacterium suaedae]|uniref:Nuclear transport factor 2 family protein n=1 Tax=Sphingobacterium suaedae TaxID=1686402 RepID=A0ABW5KEL6_9SPHI
MKNVINSIALAVMMLLSFSASATEPLNPLKDVTSTKILTTYLEATTLGSVDLNKFLFSEDFEYRNSANGDRFNKKEYTAFLKAHKGVKYDCKTSYEILDQTGQACMAKATMNFGHFTRIDYITLSQTEDGWKVSKVVTTYPK